MLYFHHFILDKTIKLCPFYYSNSFLLAFFVAKDSFIITVFYKYIVNIINQTELKTHYFGRLRRTGAIQCVVLTNCVSMS